MVPLSAIRYSSIVHPAFRSASFAAVNLSVFTAMTGYSVSPSSQTFSRALTVCVKGRLGHDSYLSFFQNLCHFKQDTCREFQLFRSHLKAHVHTSQGKIERTTNAQAGVRPFAINRQSFILLQPQRSKNGQLFRCSRYGVEYRLADVVRCVNA